MNFKSVLYIFQSYMTSGGPVMIPIFLVSMVAWYIGFEKMIYFRKFQRARRRYLRAMVSLFSGKPHPADPATGMQDYDRFIGEMKYVVEKRQCTGPRLEILFKEFLINTVPSIEKSFSTMSAWTSVAPLLGLLGTVAGMIQTFRVITDFGLGNPNLTAEGISVALITTQAGLTVAFPLVLFHNYLFNRSRQIIARLIADGEELMKRTKPPAQA